MACARPADKAVCDFFDFSRLHSCPSAVPTLSSDLNWDKYEWVARERGGRFVLLFSFLVWLVEKAGEIYYKSIGVPFKNQVR